MNPYIADTSHSTSALIRLIFDEEREMDALTHTRDSQIKKAEFYYKEFLSKDLQEDFDERRVMYDFGEMARARKEAEEAQAQIKVLEASIDAKDFSLRALSGALLQIAKQGISLEHGGLSACPTGRSIGSESLKNVIWQARNQSMHFEEGKPHQPVRSCFRNLENDFGAQFSLASNPPLNLARHVVKLLGWGDYSVYEMDMSSIL
jgi:hypothetical protein